MAVNVINVDSVDDIFVSRLVVVVVTFVLRQKSMIKFLDRENAENFNVQMRLCEKWVDHVSSSIDSSAQP